MRKSILLGALLASQFVFTQGFLKTEGQKIVNEKGENIVLRGLGIGGWMLQEGYMLKTSNFAGPQHQIKQKIADLIGEEGKDEFYKAYLKNGFTKADVDSLAKWGFNSVRLPMHYDLYTLPIEKEPIKGQQTWLEEGFKMTDDVLQWCKDNKMYLILDLHAAPGGQGNDANISDYDKTKPNLWDNEYNQQKTIELWKKLAERYKDEAWIGGYDLINEPNINFTGSNPNGTDEQFNIPLWKLQQEITDAIRKIDQKHIIFWEGNGWGNNYNGLTEIKDNNIVLSFHKYWNDNNQGALQGIINLREKFNVPIWLGETGENSNVWFTQLIRLLDQNNIGWAFWPMKKIDNIAGINNVKITPEYQKLLDYWNHGGEKPSKEFATKALMKIAENYKHQNVEIKYDVIDAMFRQTRENTAIPFKNHQIPGKINASDYDLGTIGIAYHDQDFENLWVSDPNKRSDWNSGQKLRNDGVDIYQSKDTYYVGKIEAGEWLQYTLNINKPKKYTFTLKYANAEAASNIELQSADGKILGHITLPTTGGIENWKEVSIKNIPLQKGKNPIRIVFKNGNINFQSFEIK